MTKRVNNPGPSSLAPVLSEGLGLDIPDASVRALGDVAHKVDVADATLKFWVSMPGEAEAFLLVSGSGNPDLVGRSVRNINQARAALPAAVGAPILPTMLDGVVDGRSFGLWSVRPDFLVGGRMNRLIRRKRYGRRICDWARAFCVQSLKPGDTADFLANLELIAQDPAFSEQMRADAQQAAGRLTSGVWTPKYCLHHGDFWTGNVLLPLPDETMPFHVIDWAGLQVQGFPFYDLVRMLISLRCSSWFAARQMAALQTEIGCDRADVMSYTLSGLGHIGRNLEHFPPERYRAMAQSVYDFVKRT